MSSTVVPGTDISLVDFVYGAQPPGANLQDMAPLVRPVEQFGNHLAAPAWPRVAPAVEYQPDVALPLEMRQDYAPNIEAFQPIQVPHGDMPQAVDGVAPQPLPLDKAPRLPDRPNVAPYAPPIAPQIPLHRAFMPAGYPDYAFRRPSAAMPNPPLGSPIQDLLAYGPGVLRWTQGSQEPIPRP